MPGRHGDRRVPAADLSPRSWGRFFGSFYSDPRICQTIASTKITSMAYAVLRPMRFTLVDPAMPPITQGVLRAREIWIDNTLRRASRCRCVALGQRRVAAFVIVVPPGVHVQANRISRIVRLGGRRPYSDH